MQPSDSTLARNRVTPQSVMKKANEANTTSGSLENSLKREVKPPAVSSEEAKSQANGQTNGQTKAIAGTHQKKVNNLILKSSASQKSVALFHRPLNIQSTASSDSDSMSDMSTYSIRDGRTSIPAPTTNVRRHAVNRTPSFQSSFQPASESGDRIAIFIDGSNLFYAASHLNIEVDYRRLLTTLVRGRRLLRAYFYTGVDPQNEKQRGFLLWLNRHGHRVVSKELAQLSDGSRKANMHVEMAVDMMRISEYCSTLTLLGGDGNLAYALQVLSQRGTSIEVVSLQSMTSDSLIDLADSYTDLADLKDEIRR